ncbi:MAG: site-2 protease family protein [Anaerolineales bacterium]|nr:site-2 protease family protein [Anaerolineales bacterium]
MSLTSVGSFFVFVVVLSGLVFVHELGHFLVAKRLGIHIEEFGFGYPPRLIGVVRDAQGRWRLVVGRKTPKPAELGGPRTIYSLNAIPVGGFVRPVGEDDPLVPGGLSAAPKRHRIAVLAAGSTFNLLLAFLVFVVGFRVGWPDRVVINTVVAGTPAAQAGLRAEDVVLAVNGSEIHYTTQLSAATYGHLGEPMRILIQRGAEQLTLTVTPREEWPANEGPMGVEMRSDIVTNYGWPQAISRAGQEMYYQFQVLFELPARIFRHEIPLETLRPIGVVGLNDLTREAVTTAQEINQWFPVLQLIGLVSVALATTNLLPLPALDGGRILFVLIEALRGRRLDPAREGMVHLIGMLMLLALMVVITYQDIINPIFPR